MKSCSFCGKKVYRLAARGLCAACYYRARRNGTPDYVKVRKPCTVAGCGEMSVAKGLCETHYRREKKHGVVDNERLSKWGHATKHPLYHSHRHLFRSDTPMVPEWREFWEFVRGVGEKPSSRHRLKRLRVDEPIGPDNFFWQAPLTDISTTSREDRAAWMRAYRIANAEKFKDADLRRYHGITLAEYDRRMEGQSGVCAICRRPESAIDPTSGAPRRLAVDHCHQHGHTRGLLCGACNTALGLFGDDPEVLLRAARYLSGHSPGAG